MAICDLCAQDMKTATSCTTDVLHRRGEPVTLFRYGEEPGWGRPDSRCGDCGVSPGGLHHIGCDLQCCPGCHGQLISCDCHWDEFADEYDDDAPHWIDDERGGLLVGRVGVFDGDESDRTATAPVIALGSAGRSQAPARPRGLVPLGAAVAPMRARHQSALRAFAEWCLARGRPCDLDAAALCIDALEQYRQPDGVRLDRPTVNGVQWADIHNAATALDTRTPEDLAVHLWSVISWLSDEGFLHSDSDPLGPLLEPLQCYGGLGPDGYPLPEGTDVDFPCQCYVRHDPTCPPHLAQHVVGRDPATYSEFIVRAHIRVRSDDPPLSCYEPLFALARRLRATCSPWEIHADECTYIGRIDPYRGVPELWLYRYDPESRRGFDDLVLDGDGRGWVPKADRRRKAGFRWVPVDDRAAVIRVGVRYAQREPSAPSAW